MYNFPIVGWLVWDPNPEFFVIPWLDWPIRWYGVFFALGFVLAYFVLQNLLQKLIIDTPKINESYVKDWDLMIEKIKGVPIFSSSLKEWMYQHSKGGVIPSEIKTAILEEIHFGSLSKSLFEEALLSPKTITQQLMDGLTWYVVIATIVGARLGHILFYDWDHYLAHPLNIFKTWEGGLASHGGAVAIPIAVVLFYRRYLYHLPQISLLTLMDRIAVVVPLAAFWIRLGNFFNQEIVGTFTTAPWAVIFGHPYEGSPGIPLHPVQLYEGLVYLLTFCILWMLSKKDPKPGFLCGLMFFLIFAPRFVLEMFKQSPSGLLDFIPFQMGQLLSIPFILTGVILMNVSRRKKRVAKLAFENQIQ